jgi:lipid II:glycine glycyltransferase (peptidoglycan interpeptide bridge formation enzyme)
MSRRLRVEYLLPLAGVDIERGMRENHRRNRRKALKAGVQVRQTAEVGALDNHVALIQASLHRRQERGEDVPDHHDNTFEACLLRTGAGRLFQAVAGEAVLSSVLVIDAADGAYYRSAGNSPEAMNCGASVLLLSEIAVQLQAEGKALFNLGGADEGSSLAAFKVGFGSQPQHSEAAVFYVGSGLRRAVTDVATRALGFTTNAVRVIAHGR